MPTHRRPGIATELRAVLRSLAPLDRALRRLAASLNGTPATGSSSRTRRQLTLTPARRAALKLQGQYMGYLRNLKPKQKAQVKAVREKKGIEAAIGVARRMRKVA